MGTFTQKTDYLIETKGLLKDRINSLGGSITNQTTFRDYLVWLDSLYEALDEKTITGLPDSLEGNITQTTTQTGKNLLPNNATTQEINGITYTINEDKSININGTATGGRADLWLYGSSTDTGNYIFIPKGNYTINTANLTDGRLFLSFREKTAGVKYVTSQNHSLFDLLAQQDCYLYGVMMGAERGQTFNNITIYPQLEKGSSPSSYEPFIPNSPSPDYPQPINITTGRQVVRVCGKNLLSYMYAKGYSTTINGITWTINQDGSITANGTATSLSIFQFANADNLKSIIGKTIKLNGTPSNAPQDCFMGIYTASWSVIANSYAGQDTNAITINDTATRVIARIPSGTTINNLTFYPMIRLSSITDTTYEEYKGNNYEINLGKNLLEYTINTLKTINTSGTWSDNVYTHNGLTITINEDKTITINGTSTAQETFMLEQQKIKYQAGTYYLSGAINGNNNLFDIRMYNYNGAGAVAQCFTGTKEINVVNNGQNYNIAIVVRSGQTLNNVVFYPMFSKSNDTNYAPYKTPIYLGKIGTYQDYIFRNTIENPLYDSNLEEGQWYIHKEIGRVVLNGSGTINSLSNSRYQIPLQISAGDGYNTSISKCNIFRTIGQFEIVSTTKENVMAVNGGFIYIRVTNSTTLQEVRTLLSNTNAIVYYVLNTPTNTLIEDEELINQLNEIEIFTVISEDFYN